MADQAITSMGVVFAVSGIIGFLMASIIGLVLYIFAIVLLFFGSLVLALYFASNVFEINFFSSIDAMKDKMNPIVTDIFKILNERFFEALLIGVVSNKALLICAISGLILGVFSALSKKKKG